MFLYSVITTTYLELGSESVKIFKARFWDYLMDLNAVPQALDEEMVLTF